jgi:hypothetical protein
MRKSKTIGKVRIIDEGNGKDKTKMKILCINFGGEYTSKNCDICSDKDCKDRIETIA